MAPDQRRVEKEIGAVGLALPVLGAGGDVGRIALRRRGRANSPPPWPRPTWPPPPGRYVRRVAGGVEVAAAVEQQAVAFSVSSSSSRSMLRFMKRTIASSGPGHQLR